MRGAAAVVHALVPLVLSACTIGPAGADGGTATGATAPARTVGDQCDDVLTEYCQKAASCALPVAALMDCINDARPLCCTGSQCDEASPTSEAVVSECKQAIDGTVCYDLSMTTNPTACLQSS